MTFGVARALSSGEGPCPVWGPSGCRSHALFIRTQFPSPWLAVCTSHLQSVCVRVDTPPANSQPRTCLRHQAPPVASHFSRGKCSPTRPPHGLTAALKVGAGRPSQDCPESKHLRTQFGLVGRPAATKGHCEGCLWSRRDPFSSPRMRLAC